MAEKKSSGTGRTRNYTAIVYPDCENTPENWMEVLSDFHIPMFISPLHDSDVNPDGKLKKPHYHVIICFEGVKTPAQAREVFASVAAVPPPDGRFAVQSLRGMARYLCHLDNPEKAQYSQADVRCLCGADYYSTINLITDKFAALCEMKDFCRKYDIDSFYLLDCYAQEHRPDWMRVLAESSSVYIERWLKSRVWSKENKKMVITDPDTGEVIFEG